MTKKQIVIGIILIIIIVGIMIVKINVKNKVNINNLSQEISIVKNEVQYDEEVGVYYLRDAETDEIIAASYDETDLTFYRVHPDYNPNPLVPKSTDLQEFMQSQEENIGQK